MKMNMHNLNANLSFVLHIFVLVETFSNNLQIIRLQERYSRNKSEIQLTLDGGKKKY